jgi:hypothetical protein
MHRNTVKYAKDKRIAEPVAYADAECANNLTERGFAVVPNVLTAAQCDSLKQQWLATMAGYEGTGFDPANRATWTTPNLPTGTRGMQVLPLTRSLR